LSFFVDLSSINSPAGREKYLITRGTPKGNAYDTSAALKHSVRFMEKRTGIKAHPDGDYIGWRVAVGKDLRAWHEWRVGERIMDSHFPTAPDCSLN